MSDDARDIQAFSPEELARMTNLFSRVRYLFLNESPFVVLTTLAQLHAYAIANSEDGDTTTTDMAEHILRIHANAVRGFLKAMASKPSGATLQ